jgi:hypothetical protein
VARDLPTNLAHAAYAFLAAFVAFSVTAAVFGPGLKTFDDRPMVSSHSFMVTRISVVLVMPVVLLVVMVRCVRAKTVLTTDTLSSYGWHVTWHVPLGSIAAMSIPTDSDGKRQRHRRKLELEDGRSVTVVVRNWQGGCTWSVLDRLESIVGARSPRHSCDAAIHPDRQEQRAGTVTIALALVVAATSLLASFALRGIATHSADEERTAVTTASVVTVTPTREGTDVGIVLTSDDTRVERDVWHDGPAFYEVEDTVRVAFDPHDLRNIAFANLPPVRAGRAQALLAFAGTAFLASALGLAALLVWSWRRRIRR